ncbi:MAG: hypothetical protein ACREBB_09970 [Nitrosotalea sp.]
MKAFSYAMIAFLLLATSAPVLLAHAQTNQSYYNMTGPGGHHGHGFHMRIIITSTIIAGIVGVGGYAGWKIYKKKKSSKDASKNASTQT